MEIRNSADIVENSGIVELVNEMKLREFFDDKHYGNNDVKLFFVVNCLESEAKPRKRFDNKDKVLYWDVILDYRTVKNSSPEEKKIILANSILNSFNVLDNYKKLNIDKNAIQEDAKRYFKNLGWL